MSSISMGFNACICLDIHAVRALKFVMAEFKTGYYNAMWIE